MPHRLPRWCRRLLWGPAVAVLLGVLAVLGMELSTDLLAGSHCHASVSECRRGDIAVVLGCSRYLRGGHRNPYFEGRMNAAAELWKSGKIKGIIVSGDNRELSYNEPRAMRAALVARGVPDNRIVSDFAGLCTYDSVVRAKKIFGAKNVTFVSQSDHVERAVALARAKGYDAEGLIAPLPDSTRRLRARQFFRERASRLVMLYHLLTGHDPHHLGEPITLPF